MVKSRADIQREYRRRLKEKNNEGYLAKERERRKKGYVPNEMLSRKARDDRNKKNRTYLKHYRQQKKDAQRIEQNAQNREENNDESMNSSGYESSQTSSMHNADNQNRLMVRMNFQNRANGPRMRVSKELKQTKKSLKAMTNSYDEMKRKYKTAMRSMQRMKRSKKGTTCSPHTPRSIADKQMKCMNISSKERDTVRKELVFANAICQEIKSSGHKSTIHKKQVLQNLITGSHIVKKYKLLRKLASRTGMSRNKLSKMSSKGVVVGKISRIREVAKHKQKVIEFMERDDNSRNMPGKADCVKSKSGERNLKRILTDYLSILYQKFVSENPGIKLSFTSFCRIRPKHVLLTAFITRDTCLCTKHQNMSLTLKAVKRQDVETSVNGEKMLENKDELVKEIKDKVTSDDIVVGQWKRVPVEIKGQKKTVMKIVDTHLNKNEFVAHVTAQVDEFEAHVSRIKHQYVEMKKLKENLPEDHCIVHMDFSENYSCKSVQEIQSAYWNQSSVTLHPVVVYYKVPTSDELHHKSIVVVSDEMAHCSSTVLTIIDKLVPEVKKLNPDISCFHYWTDSPTSQYRNKIIFNAVANHEAVYGVRAKWNYWEAGHGKGPCDGLGGTCKRMADEAVKTGKVAIQDPSDFYAWTQSMYCNLKNVMFLFVSSDSCQQKADELGKLTLKPVVGTMKIHAVAGRGTSIISVRNISCYCETCLSDNFTCDAWRNESLSVVQQKRTSEPVKQKCTSEPEPVAHVQNQNDAYTVNEYIAAVYMGKWYVGQIKDIDNDDNTVEVSFLEKKKALFQWPSRPDVI